MAIRISFDNAHNAIPPTLVLASKSGNKIGAIPATDIVFADAMVEAAQMTFYVSKQDCKSDAVWNGLVDFKLIWAKEWNRWFEAVVSIDESDKLVKNVTATALGNAELSQINLYGVEINTETDIERDDYVPSVLYNASNQKASILHRILKSAPHYTIGHVDSTIANIQRTFTFDGKTITGAFDEIADEIKCVFSIDCYCDADMNLIREVNVYDLEATCLNPDCMERGPFIDTCSKCGGDLILPGYGEDTSIFVNTENLASDVQYSTDTGSVKNCFRLEAGDDLMTATIANINPNGTGDIWYISDDVKSDMSPALSTKLNQYDALYDEYQTTKQISVSSTETNNYNALVQKYNGMSSMTNKSFSQIGQYVVSYPKLIELYYDTIDFNLFLTSALMPNSAMQSTNASSESSKLKSSFMSFVAVKSLSGLSKASADSAVLSMAKTIVDNRYQVRVESSSLSTSNRWTGSIKITNFSDEEDTATATSLSCQITNDYDKFVKQALDKSLQKNATTGDATDIVAMFKLSDNDFKNELKYYSLNRLTSFNDACQACIDIMIEQGVANKDVSTGAVSNVLYDELYVPYLNKLGLIQTELALREKEVNSIVGKYDQLGDLVQAGMQTVLINKMDEIRAELNMRNYVGDSLWNELISYRRDDTYRNENYTSDGLDNAQIFKLAIQFINEAKKEIYKSATMQHSIQVNMSNLLVMKEFEPIWDKFETGNWIRVRIDGGIYRLRMIGYKIEFSNLDKLTVTFSDVTSVYDGFSDVEDILNKASDMSSSFGFYAAQAKRGSDGYGILNNWVENSLSLTQLKIVNDADNQNISWDSNGLTCKEYIPELDAYDDRQLKIINRGLYITDDAWRTSSVGVGNFIYYDPRTGQYVDDYGVIARTLVGVYMLSQETGIFNESGSITMDRDGLKITSDMTADISTRPVFSIRKKEMGEGGVKEIVLLDLDNNGNFVLNASSVKISASSGSGTTSTLEDRLNTIGGDISGAVENEINSQLGSKVEDAVGEMFGNINDSIDYIAKSAAESSMSILENKITTAVSEAYVTKDYLNTTFKSSIDQTSADIKFSISTLSQSVSNVSNETDELDEKITEMSTYFRFNIDGQYIGKEGSDSYLHLNNDTMEIVVSDTAVTTVDRSGLTASEASINTLHMGDYVWIFDPITGHLTLQ